MASDPQIVLSIRDRLNLATAVRQQQGFLTQTKSSCRAGCTASLMDRVSLLRQPQAVAAGEEFTKDPKRRLALLHHTAEEGSMKHTRLHRHAVVFAMALHLTVAVLHAATIDLSIVNPVRIGPPGDVETFQGTITNNTGAALASTDLFFDFSGFDSTNVTLDQLLGLSSFSIPDGSTSPVVDLFTFSLSNTAAVPATYPAQVLLQSAFQDFSSTETVSVSTVPEPGSLTLAAAGLVLVLLGALRKRLRLLLAILALAVLVPILATAQVSMVQFATNPPGVTVAGQTLLVAIPIVNKGSVNATNVQVTAVTLRTAARVSPVSFPVGLGNIGVNQIAVFQANFNATGLVPNTPYLFTIRGTYQVGTTTAGFTVNRFVQLSPPSPGSAPLKTVTIGPHTVSGAPFPPQPPTFDNEVNPPGWTVPTGSFVPGTPTQFGTSVQRAVAQAAVQNGPKAGVRAAGVPQDPPVTFNLNNGLGVSAGGIAEPSGATSGNVVFASANWLAAYSSNGGANFTQLNPTTIFPNDAIGFCCDQIVQYVPSIDRFIWLLQGNGQRIATASPADIVNSGGTAWTYWNLTPGLFGESSFDYPDLSVGDNYLYMSWNASGANSGHLVARTSLAGIQAGGTISIDYTNPADSRMAWFAHLMQNPGNEIFWAGHNDTSHMRIFSLAEGSNSYFWRDVEISTWSNSGFTSTSPDGQNWLGEVQAVGAWMNGATRVFNQLWFAWTAGTDNFFQQPHVEMVTFDRNNNFQKIQQVQIWNNSYAFGYPALNTNGCTGEIGLSLEYGGNGNYENHVVGFWGDFVVYITTNSNVGSGRFGDYVTLRQYPGLNGEFMAAFGYGIDTTQTDVRYVVFGRGGACNIR
jgi:hypothetical protein